MTGKPVNWLVCSRGDLSDDDWHKLRMFVAAELEKGIASVDRSPQGEDPEGLHAEHESAVTAKPADAQPEGPLP